MQVKWCELHSSKPIPYDDDTLALWAPGWIYTFLMHCGVKSRCLDVIRGDKISWNVYFCLCINWYLSYKGDTTYWIAVYPIVYILCVLLFLFLCFLFFACFSFFWDFVGISSANPHETLLVHLGEQSGLKGLLHTLNATVIPTKVS